MKFRVFVGICLAAIAYGVLYSDLPCWAQLMTKSMECQSDAYEQSLRLQMEEADKAHPNWRKGR